MLINQNHSDGDVIMRLTGATSPIGHVFQEDQGSYEGRDGGGKQW